MDHRWQDRVFGTQPQVLCLAVTCLFASLAGLSLVYLGKDAVSPASSSPGYASSLPDPSSASEKAPSTAGQPVRYLMKNHGGRLAVFQAQEQSPLLIFDVYINTLPEYDQQLLQEGIPAEGEEQLTRLIEDYIS